jgi:hypothetical protein
LDPVVSLLIAAVIVVSTWNLFKQSLHLLFDGVPEGVDLHAVHVALRHPGAGPSYKQREGSRARCASASARPPTGTTGLDPVGPKAAAHPAIGAGRLRATVTEVPNGCRLAARAGIGAPSSRSAGAKVCRGAWVARFFDFCA